MRRLMNWLAIGLVTIAGLLSVAYSVVFLRSESMLKRTYPVPTVAALTLPTDATSIAEGERLAIVHGCTGCHGRQLQGGVMFDDPKIAHIVAPNLTQSVRNYTDAEFIAAIRHGLRPDGHTMIVMPSEGFLLLTDEDLGRIIAFVRNLPVTPGPTGSTSIGPIGRVGLVTGLYKTTAQHMLDAVAPPEATNEEANFGRYLARTTCVQCHAADLRGDSLPEGVAPDLRVVATYSPETFSTLMRTGIAIGDRKLGMMTNWAVGHLSHLTDAEIAALYSYLHELPEAAAH